MGDLFDSVTRLLELNLKQQQLPQYYSPCSRHLVFLMVSQDAFGKSNPQS